MTAALHRNKISQTFTTKPQEKASVENPNK